jgi:hypothetical protein
MSCRAEDGGSPSRITLQLGAKNGVPRQNVACGSDRKASVGNDVVPTQGKLEEEQNTEESPDEARTFSHECKDTALRWIPPPSSTPASKGALAAPTSSLLQPFAPCDAVM